MPGPTTVLNGVPSGAINGHSDGPKGGKRPLPHIDDITSVTVDIDQYAPVEKILQAAETSFRQAESSKTFGRPDLALKEYVRACIILLDILPHNKGWASLQRDNRSQFDRYQRLRRQINAAHGDFEAIKDQIKADNLKTGVRPTSHSVGLAGKGAINGQDKDKTSNGIAGENGVAASPPPKNKPVVHPKPKNLHGNALPSGSGSIQAKAQVLVQRFANLRPGASSNITRGAHTRTQSEMSPALAGSPGSSEVPPSSPPLDGAIPELPQMPAAIYNPPRGSISSETAALPTSAPRSMFTRTNSTTSVSTVKANKPPPPSPETSTSTAASARRAKPVVPDGNTISVEDLLRCMKVGSKDLSILLIDIRSREDFDEGHIMSQATICVEPEILRREYISADQIADSMVLAPPSELDLYEKRHRFDLVVFYDQNSEQIPDRPLTPEAKAVFGLFNALTQYEYPGPSGSRASPKLLRGGIEAWTSVVGNASLQCSTTAASKKYPANPMARSFFSPRQTYVTQPIQDPAEAKRWEDTIADTGAISPVRTTEEFLRRFPSISEQKESMVSPASPPTSRPQSPFQSRLSHEENLYKSLPSPPTRPPPAVPRRSYSGLAEAEDNSLMSAMKSAPQPVDTVRKFRTGLQNPGVFCFANSSLQAMFATPGFAREIWTGAWKELYKVPMKPDEKFENPQLLLKCLTNLFHWLNQGSLRSLAAKTFMVRSPLEIFFFFLVRRSSLTKT